LWSTLGTPVNHTPEQTNVIEVTTHVRSVAQMRATADYLNTLAGIVEGEAKTHKAAIEAAGFAQMRVGHAQQQQQPQARIAPEDNPAAGVQGGNPLVPLPVAVGADLAAATAAFGATPASSVPVPPPAAPASASPVPTAPPAAFAPSAGGSVNPAGVELDKRGIPWSSQIHSTPPTKTAEGVWRKRRGLNDDTLVARVEAELLAAQRVQAPAATVPVPPVSVAVPLPPSVAPAAPTPTPSAPPSVALAGVPTATTTGPGSLAELLAAAAPFMQAGKLDMPRVLEACKVAGLDGLAGLQTRPDLVPSVWAEVQKRITP
jgi:hypothetical protein